MALRQLSEKDEKSLTELLRAWRQTRRRPHADGPDLQLDQQAPETYLAYTPPGGIPKPNLGATGTGTAPEDDVVYSVECQAYDLTDNGDGTGSLSEMTGKTIDVFNITPMDVPENTLILVTRLKTGLWVVPFWPAVIQC